LSSVTNEGKAVAYFELLVWRLCLVLSQRLEEKKIKGEEEEGWRSVKELDLS
jgi:hypothetical protein